MNVPALVWAAATVLVVVLRRFPPAALGLASRWTPDADRRVVDDAGFRSYFIDAAPRTSPPGAVDRVGGGRDAEEWR